MHMGMAHPAQLGTLGTKHGGLIGFQANFIHSSRQHVDFAAQARHPKCMYHIRAAYMKIHRLSGGHDELVSSDYLAPFGTGIAHLPPPLMANDFDHFRRFIERQRQHALPSGHAKRQQRRNAGNGQDEATPNDPTPRDTALLGGCALDVMRFESI